MLVQVSELRFLLGVENPDQPNSEIDPVLERSLLNAQAMVSAYIGFDLEPCCEAYTSHTVVAPHDFGVIRLPSWPVNKEYPVSVYFDGRLLSGPTEDSDGEYRVDYRAGMVFPNRGRCFPRGGVREIRVEYTPGFDAFSVPRDLKMAISNVALAIYRMGGDVSAATSTGSTGALKSMTMFDAMSMSFDTGGENSITNNPGALVGQWAFVLDRYRTNVYTMAGV